MLREKNWVAHKKCIKRLYKYHGSSKKGGYSGLHFVIYT